MQFKFGDFNEHFFRCTSRNSLLPANGVIKIVLNTINTGNVLKSDMSVKHLKIRKVMQTSELPLR